MQSRRTVPRVTRPDLVIPGPAGRAVRVPPDRVPAASAVIAAVPPARAAVLTRPHASQVTRPDGWPVAARPTPSPPTPPPKGLPPRARAPRNPRRAAWPLVACLGALVVPAAIVVALALRAGGSSLPEGVLFGSLTSPATGESATSTPGLNAFGRPFVDPGIRSRVTTGGKAHWASGYPGLPGFFIPPPSAARAGGGRHRSHRGLGQRGNGGGHPGKGPAPKPTHSPGGSRGSTPTPKPPSKTPKPVHSSQATTPAATTPAATTPAASTPPPASTPPATRSP
jgi:hypothetical protein